MRRSRRISARKSAIAFVVEGETEMWYLQMLKKNEEKEQNVRINIKPEIPQDSKLEDQYKLVLELAKEYNNVFWILDFDVILKETRECGKGDKSRLKEFLEYRKKLKKEYDNVKVVINNPCFEYWFLLHFEATQKKYPNCSSAIKKLEKQLPNYSKSERYFKNKSKDIYARLRPYLKDAIENAVAFGGFNVDEPDRAMCEMNELFMIEELKKCRE